MVPYSESEIETEVIRANPPVVKENWANDIYSSFKLNLKKDHLRKQNDRCAYCRNDVEADGNYEPIEHIVAKSIRPTWLLVPKNLVVTCNPCNNLKNDEQTLTAGYLNSVAFPDRSEAFLVFNPHYERWSDHFIIENEIFLTAKPDSKGADTIRICKLYRYNIPVNNAKLIRMSHEDSYKTIAHKIHNIHNIDSQEYLKLKSALNYYEERIDPNTLPALKIKNPILPGSGRLLLE